MEESKKGPEAAGPPKDAKTLHEEEEKKQQEHHAKEVEKMKMMADSMVDIAFFATVMDIEKTLRAAVKKLFRDKGVSKKDREQRARGLLMMGKIFMKHGETDT